MTLYEMLDTTLWRQPVWIYTINNYDQNYPIFKGMVKDARKDINGTWDYLMHQVKHYECDTGVLLIKIMSDNPDKEFEHESDKLKRYWRYDIEIDDELKEATQAKSVRHEQWKFVHQARSYLEAPYGDTKECTGCGYEVDVSENYKYCPNCGARMDGEPE